MDLGRILTYFIESGREGRKVDLKRELHLETKSERARFAKDVLAMANTSGGPGYLIIGVVDLKDRTSTRPEDYISGFAPTDMDEFERTIQQTLEYYCNPPPVAHLQEMIHPTTGRTLGVVVVPRSQDQPHMVKVDGEGLRANDVYVRRGTATFPASREELQRMFEKRGELPVLISMSGKPITESHLQQLRTQLGRPVDEVISIPHELDDAQPYAPQILERVRQTGLTPEEWASLPIVLNAHPLSPANAVLMAVVHGLKGCFPDVIRWRRVGNTQEYEVAEILHPQPLRDQAARSGIV